VVLVLFITRHLVSILPLGQATAQRRIAMNLLIKRRLDPSEQFEADCCPIDPATRHHGMLRVTLHPLRSEARFLF
jgi:hypothetical protein